MRASAHDTRTVIPYSLEPAGSTARQAAFFERVAARIYRYFTKQVWDAGEAEKLAQAKSRVA